jgi:hypothetical protein
VLQHRPISTAIKEAKLYLLSLFCRQDMDAFQLCLDHVGSLLLSAAHLLLQLAALLQTMALTV